MSALIWILMLLLAGGGQEAVVELRQQLELNRNEITALKERVVAAESMSHSNNTLLWCLLGLYIVLKPFVLAYMWYSRRAVKRVVDDNTEAMTAARTYFEAMMRQEKRTDDVLEKTTQAVNKLTNATPAAAPTIITDTVVVQNKDSVRSS